MPYWRLSGWYFFYFAFVGAFAPYFGLYLQSLSFSAWEISVVISLMPMMRLLAPVFWAWLAERIDRRIPIVRASAVMSLVVFSAYFFTQSFVGVFFCQAILTFFWSASLPLVEALTLGHLNPHAEKYSGIRVWGSIGFIVAVLGVGRLLDAYPVSALLDVCLLIMLGILGLAMSLIEAPRLPAEAGTAAVAGVRAQGQLALLLVATFLMSAAHGPLYVFFSIHLVDIGYDKTLVGGLWSLGVVAEIVVFLFMPALLRRYRLRGLLLFSFACAVLRFLLIGWLADSLVLLLLAQVLHGATFGVCHAAAVAALHRWYPDRQQSRVQVLYGSVSFGAGGMVGGLASGQVWQLSGAGMAYTLGSAFALVGLALVWWRMRKE